MSAAERRSPGRPRDTDVDRAILDAALDRLIDYGLEGLGFEQVARTAGVTRATVYRRYPTRDELVLAAIAEGHRRQAPPDVPDEPDMEDLIVAWAHALADPWARRLQRRLMTIFADNPELFAEFRRVSIEPRHEAIDAVLRRAQQSGDLSPAGDLEMVRTLLTSAVAGHLLTHPDNAPAAEIARYLQAAAEALGYRKSGQRKDRP